MKGRDNQVVPINKKDKQQQITTTQMLQSKYFHISAVEWPLHAPVSDDIDDNAQSAPHCPYTPTN